MTEELRGRIEGAWNAAKACTPEKACTPTPERSVRVILADADSTLTDALGLLHRIYGSIRAEENTLVNDNEPPRDMTDTALTLADKAARLLDVANSIAVALGE